MLKCNSCKGNISPHSDLAFFERSKTEIHLVTKYEKNNTLARLEQREKEGKKRVSDIIIHTYYVRGKLVQEKYYVHTVQKELEAFVCMAQQKKNYLPGNTTK